MEGLDRRISAIERDREHGATHLTLEALGVLGDAAGDQLPDGAWASHLIQVSNRLVEAKPAMAGLRNATTRLLTRLLEAGPEHGRHEAGSLCWELIRELYEAAEGAAATATSLLPAPGALATCSYSSAALRVLRMCREAGKTQRAVVFEPEAGPEAPGRRLATKLTRLRVPVALAGGRSAKDAIWGAQAALIGADAVTPRHVLNGAPSLALARAAKGRIPFYVVCETVKLTERTQAESGYDEVPLELVTGIVTEDGMLAAPDVRQRLGEIA